jgi:hypothetical protein
MEATAELERYLRTAPILATAGPVVGGGAHPGKQRLLLLGGVQVIAKPAIEREETERMIRCEAAAWQVAKALGFGGLIATTVLRRIPSADGDEVGASIQVIWPDGHQFCAALELLPDGDIWEAAVFDAVVLHADHNLNNWLAVPAPGGAEQPRLKLIDNGYAFFPGRGGCNSSFYAAKEGVELPDLMISALEQFLGAWPIQELEELLDDGALRGVRERAEHLLQRGVLAL